MCIRDSLAGDWATFKDALHHLALPAIALSTIPASIIARIARSAMLDVLGQDYICLLYTSRCV